ncbi:MAG TPA: DUF4255 domain-containing protein [Burkholderiales bacterium]|nr:DUF4255 domain-containing protein [Burkholderiales bacterium]
MLDLALKFLTDELNAFLIARTGSTFGSAVATRLATDAGKWAIPDDQLGVALINIEEERAMRSQVPHATYVDGRHVVLEPEIKLNLYVLFAAYFGQYDQGLRQLSHVITFFQSHPIFTPDRYAALDPRIEKLAVDLISPTFDQLNQIWTFVGAKQLPSALYRLRMVILQDDEPGAIHPPITKIGSTVEVL